MTLNDRLADEIIRLSEKRQEHLIEKLLNPAAITSHAEYLRVVGHITGLRETLPEIVEEALDNINKH